MKAYKCSCCGREQYSDKPIEICSKCGSSMVLAKGSEATYIRKEMAELLVKSFEYSKANESFLDFPNLEQQLYNFPSMYVIINAVKAKPKNIDGLDLLAETLENYETKVLPDNSLRKPIKVAHFVKMIDSMDKTLAENLKIFNYSYTPKEIKIDNLELEVTSKIESELVPMLSELLSLAKELIKKMKKFIVLNNVFGYGEINYEGDTFANKKLKERIKSLEKCINKTKAIVNKKYEIDFFSDGSEEIDEMYKALYSAVYAIVRIGYPKFNHIYYKDNVELNKKELFSYIDGILDDHYASVNEVILSSDLYPDIDVIELGKKLADFHTKIKFNTPLYYFLLKKNKSGDEELNELIGLNNIKNIVNQIKAYALSHKDKKDLNLHMCFYGNPGSGKTEVARIIAKILYENGVLPSNKLIEVDRSDLIGEFIGETPIKTMKAIMDAMGGVLFIDEAYSLLPKKDNGMDYGNEAVATLIKAMEDFRGKFCVILAGYKNPLMNMIESNPGFKSRISFNLEFNDYSREELKEIAIKMIHAKQYFCLEDALEKILDITDVTRQKPNFANAREIRNIIQGVILVQSFRVSGCSNNVIILEDVLAYIKNNKLGVNTSDGNFKIEVLTNEDKLNNLIGLGNVKKTIKKIKAFAKKNKDTENFNIHMCFYGNPGTGKTEVARLLSEILYDAGVLETAKLTEIDATGLIGEYVGQTGPKTHEAFMDALGGVLFIDEAYNLMPADGNIIGYGSEAIATLLKDMEDYRGESCVILAGYRHEMASLLDANPGFKSRIQFEIDFPDYSRDELKEIAKLMVNKKHYQIEDNALDRMADVVDCKRDEKSFANAREVRNVLDQVILNQNVRTEEEESNDITIDDVNEYIEENHIELGSANESTAVLGDTFTPDNGIISIFKQIGRSELMSLDSIKYASNEIDYNYLKQAIASIYGNGSQGTAFMVSPTGLCITCNHCIKGDGAGQSLRILDIDSDGNEVSTEYKFVLIRRDSVNDIAIIRITNASIAFKYLILENRDYSYTPLKQFLMVGYPFGGETFSMASFTSGSIASVNMYNDRRVVFADMFGKPGNSGSPVLDQQEKKLIGLFWGGIGNGNEMINCFTPIDIIRDLIEKED